jgi:hypothetical protein
MTVCGVGLNMHSKNQNKKMNLMCMGLGLSFLVTGCGMLGTKDQPAVTPVVANNGCLNDSKDLVTQYIAGQSSSSQWKGAFDCVNQSLDFFTEYVKGSVPDGYTQGDMFTLISRFLFTNNSNLKIDIMAGAFHLKSALFGGDATVIKVDELNLLKTSLTRLRDITADLIPYLAVRQQANPDPQQLLDMVAAFKTAGDQMGDYVATLPSNYLTDAAVTSLVDQLSVVLNLPKIEGLGDQFFLAKWILLNTRRDAIEATDWPVFFKDVVSMSGILLAFNTAIGPAPTDGTSRNLATRIKDDYVFRETLWTLANQAKPYLLEIMARHNGFIPFPVMDHVIDALPDDMLDTVPKDTLKAAIRPLFRRLFISDTQFGFDTGVVNTLFSIGDNAVANLGAMDRFYEKSGVSKTSMQPDDLKAALSAYASSLTDPIDQARFQNVQAMILSSKPLFLNDTGLIQYQDGVGYSRFQNLILVAMIPLANHVLKTYGSASDHFVAADYTSFFADYGDLLFALKMIDPTVPNFGPQRLQDMDLFTPVSDGNQEASIPELMQYAMMVISAGTLTDRMRAEITPVCDAHNGVDLLGWEWITADCFRKQFSDRLPYWIDNFPHLKAYWATLTTAEQTQAMMWLEHGARRNGYNEDQIAKFDLGAMAAVLNYTESLFMRFDVQRNEILYKAQVNTAYPVFKNLLATKAKLSPNLGFIIKGIFTYIVHFRQMPDTTNIGSDAKLAWWLLRYDLPTTNYSADRAGVFNIVCQLAAPEIADPDPKSPNSAANINKRICE